MTTVADAIRSKTGGAEPLSFPDGFNEAIEGISGGDSDPVAEFWLDILMNPLGTYTREVTIDKWVYKGLNVGGVIELKDGILEGVNCIRVELPDSTFNLNASYPHVYIPKRFMHNASGNSTTAGACTVVPAENTSYVLRDKSFAECYLTEFPFTEVVSTGTNAFYNTKFVDGNITLPVITGSVNSISAAFLTGITSDGTLTVTSNGTGTTFGGSELMYGNQDWYLVMKETTPPTATSSYIFGYVASRHPKSITVPKGSLEAYQTATNWSTFADIMVEAEE